MSSAFLKITAGSLPLHSGQKLCGPLPSFIRRQSSSLVLSIALLLALSPWSWGVVNRANSTYNTTAPTASNIPNWNTGWSQPAGQSGVTGWNYVGQVNGASGVYLGNGWAITAGHVGAGDLTLNGTDYPVVSGSARGVTNSSGTADLTLFKLTLSPNLPALTIATSAPTSYSQFQAGSQLAMFGYGGGQGETWGLNTVTSANQLEAVSGFESTDFETMYGTIFAGTGSVTNNYSLVSGDSGGGDFIYNSSTQAWQLAGINEAVDGSGDSIFVQLSSYSSQINPMIQAVPEPSSGALFACSLLAFLGYYRGPRSWRDRRLSHS